MTERTEYPQERVRLLHFTSTEHLSPRQVVPIAIAVQDLYTRCWLINEGRIEDLQTYALTRDSKFEQEAGIKLHRGLNEQTEEVDSPQGTTFELSVPATNDPKVLKAVEEAIKAMWDKKSSSSK